MFGTSGPQQVDIISWTLIKEWCYWQQKAEKMLEAHNLASMKVRYGFLCIILEIVLLPLNAI